MIQPNTEQSPAQPPEGAASLLPYDMITALEDMSLDEVIRLGEDAQDRPRGDKDDYRKVSVRCKILGFGHETRRIAKFHDLRHVVLVHRLTGKHGLCVVRADTQFKEVEGLFDRLSEMLNEGKVGDRAVELLEDASRVQYRRVNNRPVVGISSYATVADEASNLAPILGLSFGQTVLACCVVSLATHPKLTVWGAKAMAEEADAFWNGVQVRIAILRAHG